MLAERTLGQRIRGTYAHSRRGVECGGDSRVHGDAEVPILDERSIALIDAGLDPVNEGPADDRGDDIADPLTWHLLELLAVGQVLEDLRVALQLREDLLDREVLILRHTHVRDVAHLDIFKRVSI